MNFNSVLEEKDNYTSMGYKFFIDGTEVTVFKRYDGFNAIYGSFNTFHVLIEIGGTNDVANGKLSSWDTNKTLKVQAAAEPGYNVWLNKSYYDVQDGSSSNNATHTATTHLRKPILKVEAIGRGVIEGTIGNLYSSKVNMVNIKMEEQLGISITGGTKVEIQQFRMTIVPDYVDSKFEINYSIFNEFGTYNAGYVVSRTVNGTETLFTRGGNDGVNDMTFGVPYYESDYNSTPNSTTFSMIDEPGTTDAIVYKLYGKTTGETRILHINRTGTNSNNEGYEDGVSFCSVKELPQQTVMHNPRYNSVIEQEGQVLETLEGVCDGRSVTVSSGTYTLDNVTTYQSLTKTITTATGSTINYKPPSGTKQVIYEFYFSSCSDNLDDHSIQAYLEIDGTKCTNQQRMIGSWNAYTSTSVFKIVFDIGNVSSDDLANAKLANWDTLKQLRIKVRSHIDSNTQGRLHTVSQWTTGEQTGSDSSNGRVNITSSNISSYLYKPTLKIKAIGRKSDTTFLNSFFNERKGQVLETLSGTCDGRTITVDSGTYTLANIETGTSISSTTYVDFPGSSIAYKPPAGTKQVIYKFNSLYARISSSTSIGLTFFIDNTEVTSVKEYFGTADDYGNNINQTYVINIDGTDDIPNGRLSSWDSLKTLKIQIAAQSGYGIYINRSRYEIRNGVSGSHSSTTLTDYLYKPNLEIQAIGDAAIQNATVVAGHSMVHFQGYSNTFTVTNSIPYITGYQDAPTSGTGYGTGLPVLKNFGNAMNTSTGIFTAPHTGLYSINVVVHKHNNTTYGNVFLVIGDKSTAFGDIKENYDNTGASAVYHIDSGTEVYLKSQTGAYPTSVNLSITALQDQVPQAISARPGMTLETLVGVFDGRSVTVSSGTYTLTDVTAVQSVNTTTWTDLTNTSISYKPPVGTRQVKFRYTVATDDNSNITRPSWRLMIDGSAYTNQIMMEQDYQAYSSETKNRIFVIDINGTNDMANGKLASWDTLKTVKLQVQSKSHATVYNQTRSVDHTDTVLLKPSIEIQAIGDGPGIVPSTGTNMTHVTYSTAKTITIGSSIPGTEVEDLRLTLKPTATDSVIELKWNIFGEMHQDTLFRVTRNYNGTDTLIIPATNIWEGAVGMTVYDNQGVNSNTPQMQTIMMYDEPNTTQTVTYKVWASKSRTDNPSNHYADKFYLNGTRSTGAAQAERGSSFGAAIEYPKTARPLDTENALTIPPFVGAINKEKLYNQSGDLYFNGKQLSNEWYKNGGDLYRLGANVGIGKSNPAYKLDVTGDINFTGSIRQNGVGFQVGGLWSGASNVYRSSGMVGFGTSTFVDTTRNPNGIHIANNNGISFLANTGQTDSRNWRIRHDDLAAWGSLQISVSDTNSDVQIVQVML